MSEKSDYSSKANWHDIDADEVMTTIESDAQNGLSSKEAKIRLKKWGANRLKEAKKVSPWQIFIAQFKDFMVMVLMAATIISGWLGEMADAITILAIIILNAILGFVQEYRAERSMEALKELTAPEARVLRDGEEIKIPAWQVVPGDIVLLDTGDRVPADLRLIEVVNMELEESTLTGESVPVKKHNKKLSTDVALGDKKNMVFAGTLLTRGRGKAVAVLTGMETEVGRIAGMMQEVIEEQTPLQKRLDQLGKWLVIGCLAICVVVASIGIIKGEPPYRMFLAGVSLAVAAIPEGLPAIVTIALAMGVQKMIRRNAIIRKLPAVETLGCTTYICSDKTGTLTQNEMTVRRLYFDHNVVEVTGQGYQSKGDFLYNGKKINPQKNKGLTMLLEIMSGCNNAKLQKKDRKHFAIIGDPTEGAFLVAAEKAKIEIKDSDLRIAEVPFDSDRKRMNVVTANGDRALALTKGAPDVVLGLCKYILLDGKPQILTKELREDVLKQNDFFAFEALRVLGAAYREVPLQKNYDIKDLEQDLIFVGLAGMIDPPRPAAIEAIKTCKQAGIKTTMITGDHPTTARAVAKEMGLLENDHGVISGPQLDELSDQELSEKVENLAVYARVSPKHKLRIVKALKKKGHVVAMTGDGVNDAPAVKEADIGVAMGKTGTDVTKEASAFVLADDNFATIVAAIEEGRAIYDNIRKFIRYLLACNVGEVLVMFLAALFGLPLPLLPIQILWVNLVTDGLPAMALGVDNADKGLMVRRPRSPKESIFAHGLSRKIVERGFQIGISALVVFIIGMFLGDGDLVTARTLAFTTLVFCQLFHVFDCKSERFSVFEVGVFSNILLVGAVCISITMQCLVLYLPVMQPIFKTVPLNGFHWAIVIFVAGWRTFLSGLRHATRRIRRRRIA